MIAMGSYGWQVRQPVVGGEARQLSVMNVGRNGTGINGAGKDGTGKNVTENNDI